MYKLLLATDRQAVLDAFEAVTTWELQGFRAPRVVHTADEAMESLKKHHADGIAIDLPEVESNKLHVMLTEQYPMLPIVHAGLTDREIAEELTELRHLLGMVNADNSNDRYDQEEAMLRVRHAFFRRLISGQIKDRAAVYRQLDLLRSRMDPTQPCVLIRFSLPEDNGYLAGRWHYGSERLEIAMRNLFGSELSGMKLLVSVMDDEQIYLLACPMIGALTPGEEASMTGIVSDHANEAIVHVKNYLGIDMRVASIHVLSSVAVLADESQRNMVSK